VRTPGEIDAVAWTVVDTQLTDALADGFSIAQMVLGEPFDSKCDPSGGAPVPKISMPIPEYRSLSHLGHDAM
jgi:hypothetical protein